MSDSSIRYGLPENYRTFYFPDGELQIAPSNDENEYIGRFFGQNCKLLGTGIIIDEDLERWKYSKNMSIVDAIILLNIEIEGVTLFRIKVAEYGDIVINCFVEGKPYMLNIFFEEPDVHSGPHFDSDQISVCFKTKSFIGQLLIIKDFIERKVEALLADNNLMKVFPHYKEIRAFELEIQKYLESRKFVIGYSDLDREN